MPTAENALVQYEAGQTPYAMHELTNTGDNKMFSTSASLFSRRTGFKPDVRPNGLITGGKATPAAAGGNNNIDVAALTCYLAGINTSVASDADVACTRGTTNGFRINSITVDSGGNVAVVVGSEATSFSETRAATGGPPLIPVGSIEIAQVRFTSTTAAAVLASEVLQVVGLHQERFDAPLWTELDESAEISFDSALALIHTGTVPKKVFASYASPIFTDIQKAKDFKAPEKSYQVNSEQFYAQTVGSVASSLNQGGFTALLTDGVNDGLVTLKGENLWFKQFPDRAEVGHILAQGILGIDRTWPADGQIQVTATISAENEAIEKIS